MTKDTMKQYALPMIAIGVILILAGGYQAVNPVLAVSAHDDSADIQRTMLATTTFTVSSPYTSCSELNMALLQSYDHNPQNGVIDYDEAMQAISDWNDHLLTDDDITQVHYAWDNSCPVDVPLTPARIDDNTDTLVTDKSEYSTGDRVSLTATGRNTGEQTWNGKVTFTVTNPSGAVYITKTNTGVSVSAGGLKGTTNSFDLPTDTASYGTWSIQSKWIDDAGTIHAMTIIDLGNTSVAGIDIDVLGGIGAGLGLLLLIGGLMARKED